MSGSTTPATADFTPPPASNGVTDFINNSSNTGKEIAQTVVSEALSKGLERAGRAALGTTAGAFVQPAVWLIGGKMPQPGDIPLWGFGTAAGILGGTIGSAAGIVTGVVKALVEDHEDGIIAEAVKREPEKYRPFITSVRNYGTSGRGIVAMTIANHGGTAWRVGPATWVYIKDAGGRLVCDYQPAYAMTIRSPIMPLRVVGRDGDGLKYQWSERSGNIVG